MPVISHLFRRHFDPAASSSALYQQWSNPSDVFSVLLILGGDVVARAIAQLAGSRVTPVAFSFGWVAYSVTALVNVAGENRLMPPTDCQYKVINGRNGFVRDSSSWVIGRIVRDFESWMDDGRPDGPIRRRVREILAERQQASKSLELPLKAGLCVSVYKAKEARPGHPGYDSAYFAGFVTVLVQLGLAAIPFGLYGNWAILIVTVVGIALSFATGAVPQWTEEKWACRRKADKTTILTRGNGSQHAIVIIGDGKGLDLEDLAAASLTSFSSSPTRFMMLLLTILWILLLITAAGIQDNTWFLLAIGGIGILDNIYAAGVSRSPNDFGVPLEFVTVIGKHTVMQTLFEVESRYPRLGRSMLATFFQGRGE
ncbi:hypothetical protein SAMD00023353_8900080 [Rosellinia necatrix]|uniref:Uncharacterized protein n=1 Tax=Rosellinia necatrix TaxID=77044 RepID=A0A1W2TVS8_ROSNE|nr:hypothetical protein SAMD00023353_8900080 [Rosellinia necatrix]